MIILKKNKIDLSNINKKSVRNAIIDLFIIFIGSIIYSVAINAFTVPNKIAPGGATGLGTIINYLIPGLPIGIAILIINIPLFVYGIWVLGFFNLAKTLIATICISLTIDITQPFIPPYRGDKLLAAIYGGVIAGVGLALIFTRGTTTGGSDMTASFIARKFPHISMGRIILFIDFIVIILAAVVFKEIETALYAVILIFASSRVIDGLLYGSNTGKLMHIISDHSNEIADAIMLTLKRGITSLDAKGEYTKNNKQVLMCAVRNQEVYKIRDIVKEIDPDAFIIISEAGEILGEGFKDLNKKNTTI